MWGVAVWRVWFLVKVVFLERDFQPATFCAASRDMCHTCWDSQGHVGVCSRLGV